MKHVLLIHYAEVGTKGGNRFYFEKRLREDVRARLYPAVISSIRLAEARLVAELQDGFSTETLHAQMDQVFGVAWYAVARVVGRDFEAIKAACLELAHAEPQARTFKAFCRRTDKTYPMTSQDVCLRLGEAVIDGLGLKVDLHNHDLAIHVDILTNLTLAYTHKHEGLRGMPGGTSGGMLCLFSGGIDSPAAAWMMMRRGARVDLLHFHPYRTSREVLGSKITTLHERLKTFSPRCRLLLIPHDLYQVEAALKIPPAYDTVLFRRFMFLAAEELCRRGRWQALVTGDCLGQVASQTLENLHAAQGGLSVPVFQPLIAMDKEDVVRVAKKIGTYETSNLAYKDCCSLLSRKPKTMVALDGARELEKEYDLAGLARRCLDTVETWDGESLGPFTFKTAPTLRSK